MLNLIRVRNYAVIDEVEIEFESGFSVMTGETGAGKSIIVDALGLALGDRADASAVRHGAKKAEISVLFDCPPGHPALEWLAEHGLDEDRTCSLRRVISSEGRSRAFVNNQPVTLQDLRTLGAQLIDIHGQHAHQSLLLAREQRRVLDSSGDLTQTAKELAERFMRWQTLKTKLAERNADDADRDARLDMLRFQLAELTELGLVDGELAELQSEHSRLGNVDQLAHGVDSILQRLYEDEQASAYSSISAAARQLGSLSEHDPALAAELAQLNTVEIELGDIASSLTRYRDRLEPDPARLEQVEARLARIRELSRRHRVDEEMLHAVEADLGKSLRELESSRESLEALEADVSQAEVKYFELAETLSGARQAHAAALAEKVTAQLVQLGLPDGKFRARIERRPPERCDSGGIDDIEFEVRLNPGHPFAALSKVASGGELSRISLALEVVDAGSSNIPTYVFDEVDAGIGGRVAEIVGKRLAELSDAHQVLCVTHLPQVASQGEHHFRITKLSDGENSRTNIRHLNTDERIEELSRMLGGVEITDTTRAHAEEMIARAGR